MTEKQQEIDDLFAMFHDFDIVKADVAGEVLLLSIAIPWGSMWKKDDYSYTIRLKLLGCTFFSCDYYLIKSKELTKIGENHYQRDTEKVTTENPKDIERLSLSIQSRENIAPDTFELHCISDDNIDFATIAVKTTDYRIYNQEEEEITLATMKQWATDWWDGIQKMWDEQKRTTTR